MGNDDIRAPHLRKQDFLGACAMVWRQGRCLMVQNERHIAGQRTLTWDLPGGQVEPRETLLEALARELREETGLELAGAPQFSFLQEGARQAADRRLYVWRSFFFACEAAGEPRAQSEALDVCWLSPQELRSQLVAPYHDSFRRWLDEGGAYFQSAWSD